MPFFFGGVCLGCCKHEEYKKNVFFGKAVIKVKKNLSSLFFIFYTLFSRTSNNTSFAMSSSNSSNLLPNNHGELGPPVASLCVGTDSLDQVCVPSPTKKKDAASLHKSLFVLLSPFIQDFFS